MSTAGIIYTLLMALSSVGLIRAVVAAGRAQDPAAGGGPDDEDAGAFVRGTAEAAFLSGGPARLTDAVLAGLHEDGRLVVAGPGVVGLVRPTARNAVEQAVLDAHAAAPGGALHWLRTAVMRSRPVQETGDALAARGLVMRPEPRRTCRRWAAAQLFGTFAGFASAAMLTMVEYADAPFEDGGFDRVSDGLLALVPAGVVGFAVALACASAVEKQLTGAGRRALGEYVASAGHLTGAAHLVATRGLAAAHPDLRAQLIAAARVGRRGRMPVMSPPSLPHQNPNLWGPAAVLWCSSGAGGGGGGFACSGSGDGGGGSACSGGQGGSACASGGGGSACSSGGGGSSCSSGGGGASCGGGGGSSCGSSSSS
ncbi:TIGR04222 domain-containing membrane protein [Streptomyces sp. G44]|uniref:TIGR04222 domain-containing membrane protein n=1 Tax=Streptomyces sp. G44 TaxID=2807632 RepID=UPI00195FB0B8|nr:TIGR04222 domain-containing membrane protein [Streptomyces sp. G44]MBM7173871.1 TIGR04222 domain-containing membrane protein [Streptomyces sp. G44]